MKNKKTAPRKSNRKPHEETEKDYRSEGEKAADREVEMREEDTTLAD
jgi:hypothetical protein